MTAPWQLWVLWGLFIGVGTGAMALVLGAIVANLVERRRLQSPGREPVPR